MEPRIKYKLPDESTTTRIPELCAAFQTTTNKKWQIETFYHHHSILFKGANGINSILLKLAKEKHFDIRDFLFYFINEYPDYIVSDDNRFFMIFSLLIVSEIGNRKDVLLIPQPRDKVWKSKAIILPSLVDANVYYWLAYNNSSTHRIYDKHNHFPISILGKKTKID